MDSLARTHLKTNLAALRRSQPETAAWLQDAPGPRLGRDSLLSRDTHGLAVLLDAGGRLVLAAACETLPPGLLPADGPARATLLLGAGLGPALRRILDASQRCDRLLVLEPRADLCAALLACEPLEQELLTRRLLLLPPRREAVSAALADLDAHFFFGDIRLAPGPGGPGEPGRFPERAAWAATLRELLDGLAYNMNMLRTWQELWTGNELGNLARALAHPGPEALRGVLGGRGAAILGAGPSLERFGPLLAARPGGLVLATSLQTLPAAQRFGITPNLCLATDGHASMLGVYDRLDRAAAAQVPLFYSTRCDPRLVAAYPGPTLPVWAAGGLGPALGRAQAFSDNDVSVNVALARLLALLGAGRLLLAGVDLSWRGERTHAAGHHTSGAGFVFDPARHVRLRNLAGEEIFSERPYMATAEGIAEAVAAHGLAALNLYAGGLRIAGVPETEWDDDLTARVAGEPGGGALLREAFARALSAPPSPLPPSLPPAGPLLCELETLERELSGLRGEELRAQTARLRRLLASHPVHAPGLSNLTLEAAGLVILRGEPGAREALHAAGLARAALAKIRRVEAALTEAGVDQPGPWA